jgi:cytosine/adenosine deaminase-related metal-dependent hydrolase
MIVYTARFVFPVSGPPIRDGAIAVEDGRITGCGPRDSVVNGAGDSEVRDLGNVAVLPGLVNAHTHIELSWMADDPPPGGDWVDWMRGLLDRRAREDRERALGAATRAVAKMRARGTVAVGDVGNEGFAASVFAASDLHAVCFLEIYGFRREDAEQRIEEASQRLDTIGSDERVARASDRVRVVITPHAPHTTSSPLLRALAGRAVASGEPLSVHLAESAAESALLRDGSGPFAGLLREREMWDDSWEPPGHTPVEYVERMGLLTPRTLAVHCVRMEGQDISKLQSRGATVVTCPRSNRRLGVGSAPVPRLLGAGVPVALGTDSLASAPDLDLFAEMAALREEHPSLSPAAVLRMATLNGANALGLGDRLGSISPGKLARLAVIRLEDADDAPLETACSTPEEVHPLESAPWERAS